MTHSDEQTQKWRKDTSRGKYTFSLLILVYFTHTEKRPIRQKTIKLSVRGQYLGFLHLLSKKRRDIHLNVTTRYLEIVIKVKHFDFEISAICPWGVKRSGMVGGKIQDWKISTIKVVNSPGLTHGYFWFYMPKCNLLPYWYMYIYINLPYIYKLTLYIYINLP